MENNNLWYYRIPQGKEFNDALLELNKKLIMRNAFVIPCWKCR